MKTRLKRIHAGRDEGLSLALALIFVLVMSLVVTALLPYTSAGLRAAGAAREVRTVQNAADGALDQAINAIRGSFILGSQPSCASDSEATYEAAAYNNSPPDVGVTETRVLYCNTGTSGTFEDQPPYAIQTLVGGVSASGNAPLVVTGGVLSNADVTASGLKQAISIEGDLYAKGVCTAKAVFVVTGEHFCADTTPAFSASQPDPTVDPLASLPEPALASFSEVDPVGRCVNGATGVVAFSPGFYTQTPKPDEATCGSKNTAWWFQPGNYYFDFPDARFTSDQFDLSDDDAQFSAAGLTIVGGEPRNWSPATASSNDVAELFTKDPDNEKPACDTSSEGVTWAFGGPTTISVGTGGPYAPDHLELCSAAWDTQHLSLFGLRDGSTRTATPIEYDDKPGAATSSEYVVPTPMAGREIDGSPVTAVLVGGTATEASIVLSGLDEALTAVPDGATITGARLRLNYWASSATGVSTAAKIDHTLTYESDGYDSTAVALPDFTTQPAADAGHVLDLELPESDPRWRGLKTALSNLSLTLTADGERLDPVRVRPPPRAAEQATSHVDGVRLEIEYIPPAVERARCPSAETACKLLTNKVDNALFLHGTVYAPLSDLEIAVHGYSSTVFERGIVVASLDIDVSASVKQTLPPFQLPRGPSDRLVRFTAQTKEPNGTWRDRIVALVQYDDFVRRPDGTTSAVPGHDVRVLRWTVIR